MSLRILLQPTDVRKISDDRKQVSDEADRRRVFASINDSPLEQLLASSPGEFHPQALQEPCVNLSAYTAHDVRPLT